MASNSNGHYHVTSPSKILSASSVKQTATSPQKLMIGVPPAATPDRSAATNGISSHHGIPSDHLASLSSDRLALQSNGKQKQIDSIEQIPLAQLEQELPIEESDLVSLAALVERLANYGYESLQNLAETLPSLPSSSKRAKIFNTALDVRKQFIKLLVLSRWSKDVAELQKSRNLIALLSEQQWQHEDVFAGLTDIRKILPNARMRNADLPTAIDVLQTGTYRRLPASIKDMAVAPKPFTDDQALVIVSRLEDALRTRMACRELVPAPLSNYTIRDGKVHFCVQGLFEAQLTASSGGSDAESDAHIQLGLASPDAAAASSAIDRWWLLDLSFLVTPTGSCAESSNRAYPRKPRKAYRERLRLWGDQELAPRPQAAHTDETTSATGPAAEAATVENVDTKATRAEEATGSAQTTEADELATAKEPVERDAPLLRLFAFLQERSLHYQMDILQHQAYELCRLNWGSNLRTETGERPRRLTVHYWTQAQGAADANQKVAGPAVGGSIQVTLVDLPDQAGASKTLAALFDHDSDDGGPSVDSQLSLTTVKRRGLQVIWKADASILADSEVSDLAVSPHSLDIEALLSLVIRRHTVALLRNLQRRILVSNHPVSRLLRPEDCALCVEHVQRQGDEFSTATEASSLSFLQIELHGKSRRRSASGKPIAESTMPPLRLSVDAVTGRVVLDSEVASFTTDGGSHATPPPATSFTASVLATHSAYARLAEASDRINVSIDALFDVLYRLDVFARVEKWEKMANYVGLRAVRKLQLRPMDLAKLGSSALGSPEAAPQLFIPLRSSFPGYFLALQPSELTGVSIALIYVVQVVDATGAPSLTLQSIEWLDRSKIARASRAESDPRIEHVSQIAEIGQKRKTASAREGQATETDASSGKKDLTMEELSDVHSYCIALVSYFRVEQQLRIRGVPYLHVGSNTSRPSPPAKRQKRRPSVSQGEPAADALDDGLFEEQEASVPASAADCNVHESAHGADAEVAALVPSLCLRATDLLGPARSHLAKPNISLRVCHWDHSDKASVQMLIKLRMKSRRFRPLHEVVSTAPTFDQHSTSAQTWIDFDDETSLLTLSTRDLDNCIPIFYTQWERVMRMTQLTREVLNASRAWQQRALQFRTSCKRPSELVELQRFDFGEVVASYGNIDVDGQERKLLVRFRWQDAKMENQPFTNMPITQSGGYIIEFGSIPNTELGSIGGTEITTSTISKWFGEAHAAANPHNTTSFELRRTVNVAARSAAINAVAQHNSERLVWKGFFKLLQDTLPLVRALAPLVDRYLLDSNVPEVEIKSATWFRLRFRDRYAVDVRLATRSRLIVSDASQPLFHSETQVDANEETGLFGGSGLLNDLLAGKASAVDVMTKGRTATVVPDLSAQFRPIPNVEAILHRVADTLQGSMGDASKVTAPRVRDLRRALLVPLAAPYGETIVQRLIPLLVESVTAEII